MATWMKEHINCPQYMRPLQYLEWLLDWNDFCFTLQEILLLLCVWWQSDWRDSLNILQNMKPSLCALENEPTLQFNEVPTFPIFLNIW